MFGETYQRALDIGLDSIIDGEKLRNARILVTGATGLIGSAVVDLLLYGEKKNKWNLTMWVSGRSQEKLEQRFGQESEHKKYLVFDALKPLEFSEEVDYVIHCASNAHPAAYAAYPVETLVTAVNGTLQLLEYLKSKKKGRMVLVSSSEVYGRKKGCDFYREDDYCYLDILNPRACYPAGKRTAETLCASYLDEYHVDSVIVRPGHIYGPTMTKEDSRAYAQFARNVLDGQDIIMKSQGDQLRSYCYVIDCASAILSVMTKGKSGEAYNISNRNSVVTIRELAEMFSEKAGVKVVFQMPEESEKKGYNLMSCSALDAEKLEKLGWRGRFDLGAGVASMLEIMRENGEY